MPAQATEYYVRTLRQVGVLNDVLDNADKVIAKGRLGPGQMVLADIAAGTFKTNTEIARDVARKHPYKEWLGRSRRLEELGASKGFLKAPLMTAADALKLQASSGAIARLRSRCQPRSPTCPIEEHRSYPHLWLWRSGDINWISKLMSCITGLGAEHRSYPYLRLWRIGHI